MSSTQEYKEARVQYWEEMLGFEYNTNSTKFRAFTACKALSPTRKLSEIWAPELWPNHSKCPRWLHDNGVDRLCVPRDSSDLREHLWRFVETKCISHFKHNPEQRGTLAIEPGSSPLAEQEQHANLWTNTKRPPRPARGSKRRFNGCAPGYSYVDECDDDDDDEEIVVCKQERSSETMDTVAAKLAKLGSTYHLRTHNTDMPPALDPGGLLGLDGRSRKRPAPDDLNMKSCGQQRAAFKPSHVPIGSADSTSKSVSSPAARHPSTINSLCGSNGTLTEIQLALYIDGHNELAGVIELTDVTTRDDLFAMIQQDLQDELGVGDRFDVVRFQRTDGEVFPRPSARSVPIKRFSQQDMWKAMVKTMLEHNIGDLEGFVIVKRGVDTK